MGVKFMKIYNLIIILLFSGNINSLEWFKNQLNPQPVTFLFAPSYPHNINEYDIYKHYKIILEDSACLPTNPAIPENSIIPFTQIQQSSLGQEIDAKVITDKLETMPEDVVGVGVQCGANAWINAATKHANLPRIRALVLDTPCADVNEVICNATYFNYIPGGKFIIKTISKLALGFYNPKGKQPIDAIQNIHDKNLPIFIIHSKEDNVFSINESRKLYLEFLRLKFKNVYLIEVNHGNHRQILNSISYRIYQQTIHQFYKKFNIPYNIQLTELIRHINLAKYQPDAETVIERMQVNIFEEYRATIVKTIILLFVAYKCHKYFPETSSKIQNYILFFSSLLKKSVNINSEIIR